MSIRAPRFPAAALALPLAGALALAACRTIPPTSGTPLQEGESLRVGVVREAHGWGLRRVELISVAERLARDVAKLVDADAKGPLVLRMSPPRNATALPEASFGPIRAQITRAFAEAARRRGIVVVAPSGPRADEADYELAAEVHGMARDDGFFVIDYLVARVPSGARGSTSETAQRGEPAALGPAPASG